MEPRTESLLAWQRASYGRAHRNRTNLVVHALTVPLFVLGTLLAALAPLVSLRAIPAGVALALLAMAAQGATHGRENEPPAPFRGPLDVVTRIFAEQWVTFPRFVLDGGFREAWRRAETTR